MNKLPFINQQKVRGWKRQIRNLEKLKHEYEQLDFERLSKYGYNNFELWLSPWSNLIKRNPPIWFRKIYINKLLELYESWENQLKLKYDNYYLKIWIYHPRFFESQLVAAVDDRIKYYENIFPRAGNQLSYPNIYQGEELNKYKWDTFIDQFEVRKNNDELDEDQIEWWKINATEIIEEDSDTLYRKHYGNIWVNK